MALKTALLIGSTLASAGVGVSAQLSAKNAADAQSKSQQAFLKRQADAQRAALDENSLRAQRNKARRLARLEAYQAASGFRTDAGTPLAVFGDIENQLDQDIDEMTNQALDALGRNESQRSNLAFGDKMRNRALPLSLAATGIQAASGLARGYAGNYDRYGEDPFKIFK